MQYLVTPPHLIASFLLLGSLVNSLPKSLNRIHCFENKESPSDEFPNSDHCLEFASIFLNHAHASIPIVFASKWVPNPNVPLPWQRSHESCWVTVHMEEEPGYDIASWRDLGQVVRDTAVECLVKNPGGGRRLGGVSWAGSNGWLLLELSGKPKYVPGSEHGQELGLYNETGKNTWKTPDKPLDVL